MLDTKKPSRGNRSTDVISVISGAAELMAIDTFPPMLRIHSAARRSADLFEAFED